MFYNIWPFVSIMADIMVDYVNSSNTNVVLCRFLWQNNGGMETDALVRDAVLFWLLCKTNDKLRDNHAHWSLTTTKYQLEEPQNETFWLLYMRFWMNETILFPSTWLCGLSPRDVLSVHQRKACLLCFYTTHQHPLFQIQETLTLWHRRFLIIKVPVQRRSRHDSLGPTRQRGTDATPGTGNLEGETQHLFSFKLPLLHQVISNVTTIIEQSHICNHRHILQTQTLIKMCDVAMVTTANTWGLSKLCSVHAVRERLDHGGREGGHQSRIQAHRHRVHVREWNRSRGWSSGHDWPRSGEEGGALHRQ